MNRKERRRLEKKYGYLKQYNRATKTEREEIRERRREMQKKLHEQNLENNENMRRSQNEENELRIFQGLLEIHGDEKAREIIEHNKELIEKRKSKLQSKGF